MAKKKIKDLTQTELRAICEHDKNCQVCRINSLRFCSYRCRCLADLFACPKNIYNQFKNEEVEIPDELFGNSEQLEQHNGLTDISNREKGEKLD